VPNEEANANVIIKSTDSWTAQESEVVNEVDKVLGGGKLDAVVCVAGGWAGGNAAADGMHSCNLFYTRYYRHVFY
jgi:dihydropteridine reductase